MKKPSYLFIAAFAFLYSCQSKNEVKLVDGPHFSVNKGKGDNGISGQQGGSQTSGNLAIPGAFGAFAANNNSKKAEPEVIVEELPRSYKSRKFMNDVSNISYDLFMIPGNIVSYNPKDSSYTMRTLKAITKNNKPPVVTPISDGLIYSAKINSNTSFNGSYLIGGINVARDEILELNIQDVAISSVPDSLIDIEAIKSAIANIPEEDKKYLYYVKSVTLTTLDNRKYTEAKFDASINSCFVTAGGKTYSSNEKFKRDRTVSLFTVPLSNFIGSR
ncbi:hypothetical protein [uncultured Mucilaginibacter sp.]|uniref:hypothetical protein n=1 Tax=uncultured Mucilaginibacter sp. TaxID=797541 RepID=UPI0025F88A4D|nr:hypothetical protein [uncultured Mucilaginibacter sp.]